jgi:hypothetical protein
MVPSVDAMPVGLSWLLAGLTPTGMPNQVFKLESTLMALVNASSVTMPRSTVGSVEGLAEVALKILPT